MVDCDIILDPKQMKVFEMWYGRSWFSFEQKAFVLRQVMQILKISFLVMMSLLRHKYPYDTHCGAVINRSKFDTCTYSSFRGVKTDTQTDRQTDRISLYILDVPEKIESYAKLNNINEFGDYKTAK